MKSKLFALGAATAAVLVVLASPASACVPNHPPHLTHPSHPSKPSKPSHPTPPSHNHPKPPPVVVPPQPSDDIQTQQYFQASTCTTPTTNTTEQRTRSYVYDASTNTWQPGPWSDWVVTSKTTGDLYSFCPTPKAKSHNIKLHLKVVDRCSCKHDSVKIRGKHLASKIVRQNKNHWTIHVVADKGWLLPKNIRKPNGKYVSEATYHVKTSNKPCPCQASHSCGKPTPPAPPKPACPCNS
jgi:hypothetical protein